MADENVDSNNIEYLAQKQQHQFNELSFLFGRETVEQASMIDIADLNLNDEMTASISNGITRLKKLRNNSDGQVELLNRMGSGERLLLCMWVMDLDLLDKILSASCS